MFKLSFIGKNLVAHIYDSFHIFVFFAVVVDVVSPFNVLSVSMCRFSALSVEFI